MLSADGSRDRPSIRRVIAAGGLAVAVIAGGLAPILTSPAQAVPAAAAVQVPGSVPPLVADHALAPVPTPPSAAGQALTVTVTLRRTAPAAFDAYLAAAENPASPTYHHFLSPSAIVDRFGPSRGSYDALRQWVESKGLSLVEGAADRLTLTVRGTRAAAAAAFGVSIADYRVGGRVDYANVDDPSLPGDLAAHVQAISGLSDLGQPHSVPQSTTVPPATGSPVAASPSSLRDSLTALGHGDLGSAARSSLGDTFTSLAQGRLSSAQRSSLTRTLDAVDRAHPSPSARASFDRELTALGNTGLSTAKRSSLEHDLVARADGLAGAGTGPGSLGRGWFGFVACAPDFLTDLLTIDPELLFAIGLLVFLAPELFLVWIGLLDFLQNTPAAIVYGICVGKYASSHGYGFGIGPGSSARPGAVPHTASPSVTVIPQKIGLLEYDSYHPSDVTNWLALLGASPSLASDVSEVNVDGGAGNPGPGESEVLLDIDTVLSLDLQANATKVVVYDAPPTTSFEAMFQAMENDGDTVISNSWSQCEDQTPKSQAQAIDSILASAELQGISVFNGTGDDGSSCLDGSPGTVGVPADSPSATAVGGTTPTFGSAMTVTSEAWWNDPNGTGQGGYGASRLFGRPSYQNGYTTSAGRSVPDVAVDADPRDGIEFCQADAGGCPEGRLFGGTSMAAPEMAAMTAGLNQALGSDIGNFDAAAYPLGTSPGTFTTAAQMGTDFEHVGLGSPNWDYLELALKHLTVGAVDATQSFAGATESVADGSTPGVIDVVLRDGHDEPVAGKSVAVTTTSATATVSAPVTADVHGNAVFTVTDTVPETLALTVTDTTDHVVLVTHPNLTFAGLPATSGNIVATPSTVANDGTSTTSITVTLQNEQAQGAAGKKVILSEGSADAQITPTGATPGVTDTNGMATFTATDVQAEVVTFTATDVTDGNLPVPGSAQVTFTGNPSSACGTISAPTAHNGATATVVASGFPTGSAGLYPCAGTFGVALDPAGNVYAMDQLDGNVYRFPPSGGSASPGTLLGTVGVYADDATFGKDGNLYVAIPDTNPTDLLCTDCGAVEEVDPSTGAVVKTVAGGLDYPAWIATDPVSGDLIVAPGGTGSLFSTDLWRVHDPYGNSPSVSVYATDPTGWIQPAFAPDGTLYVLTRNNHLVSLGGTNSPQPATETTVLTSLPLTANGLQLGPIGAGGAPTSIYVGGGGSVDQVTVPGGQSTQLLSGATDPIELKVGPDGCIYLPNNDTVVKLTDASGSCGLTPATGPPSVFLSGPGATNPPAGSSVTFSARLANVTAPAGTPIRFAVTGANQRSAVVDAGADGTASFSYRAVHPGADTVVASATIGTARPLSNPISFTWAVGKDTTFVTLDGSQEIGPVGTPATVRAGLYDVSQNPASPVGGARVTVTVGGRQCVITTDGSGHGTCTVTPSSAGLLAVHASYAGTGSLTSSSSDASFFAGGPSTTAPPAPPGVAQGYRLVALDGGVFAFGDAPFEGSLGGVTLAAPIVGLAPDRNGTSYWLTGADGGVFAFGGAPYLGSMGGRRLAAPVVGIAATPSGAGYWLVARDGGMFAFGDAAFFGSMGGKRLNAPIVGIAPTPDGHGYWEVASDGGIFAFGDAPFFGSTGGKRLNAPIVGIAPTPDGHGYWEVASDGGVFAFGDAAFFGSTGGKPLNAPIVGVAGSPDSGGYWLVAADGGVFGFGDANFLGSMGGRPLDQPVIGIETLPSAGSSLRARSASRTASGARANHAGRLGAGGST